MKLKEIYNDILKQAGAKTDRMIEFTGGNGGFYWGNTRFQNLHRLKELEVEKVVASPLSPAIEIYINYEEVEHKKELLRGDDIRTVRDVLKMEDEYIDELTDIELHDGTWVLWHKSLETIEEFLDREIVDWSVDDYENVLSIEIVV